MSDQAVILLVEDQEDDILLIRQALAKANIENPLQVVRSGESALAYLKGEERFANRFEHPLPSLVLLDLKLTGMDGFDVLEWIREQDGLRSMRVLVLTSSDQIRDVNRAYQLGANSFLIKPVDFENLVDLVRLLKEYWLVSDRPPTVSRAPSQKQKDAR